MHDTPSKSPPNPPFDEAVAHRWFAVECNNQAWDLVEAASRTAEQDHRMVALAYAASLHWHEVGTDLNRLRASNLLATVCAAVGDGAAAQRHSAACLAWLDRLEQLAKSDETADAMADNEGKKKPAVTDFDRACAHGCAVWCLIKFVHPDEQSPQLELQTQQARAVLAKLPQDDAAMVRKLYPVA